jgi:ankyrin repeat protein
MSKKLTYKLAIKNNYQDDKIINMSKKINTSDDDYFLNPYKFKYNNQEQYDINFDTNSTDLGLIIKTLTSIVMSNSKSNYINVTDNYSNNNEYKKNKDDEHLNIFKFVATNKFDKLEECLINKNININIQDNDGDTPLHIAVFLGNIRACEILIEAGANIYVTDKWGQTPFHRICFCLDNQNVIKIINLFYKNNNDNSNSFDISHNNIFNQVDYFGNTSFHLVLKYIIKNKIKLNETQLKFIKKLKLLTNIKLKNKEGFSIENLLLCI